MLNPAETATGFYELHSHSGQDALPNCNSSIGSSSLESGFALRSNNSCAIGSQLLSEVNQIINTRSISNNASTVANYLDVISPIEIHHSLRSRQISSAVLSENSSFNLGDGVLQLEATGHSDELTNSPGGNYHATSHAAPSPANHPLIGVIDTGFSTNNPDIDPSRLHGGRDRIDGDDNPFLEGAAGDIHGTHVLNVIAATQNNGIGVDGINDEAPVWLGRAVGSGRWAESLVEFVDAAKTSGQPNAIVNLSFDLIQVNADGSISTRHELTASERAALTYAQQNHVIIVAAAGNTGEAMSALGQAATEFDNIITVGAGDQLDRASYSSYGNGLSLLANADGEGTSVATAKVTGVASQVWAANPELSYRQVINLLESTAIDLQTPGWDAETGNGLINPIEAISTANSIAPEHLVVAEGVIVPMLTEQPSHQGALEQPDAWWNPVDWVKSAWDGIKKGSKWLYNEARDSVLVDAFEQTIDFVKSLPSNLTQLGKDYKDLVIAVGKGNWSNAARSLERILIDYVDLSGTPHLVDLVADAIKPTSRSLTSAEIELAKSVFGDSINYSLVRIDEGSLLVGARKYLTGGDDAPFTLFNTVNSLGRIDISRAEDRATLIHELAHVWQYQHTGSIYAVDAIIAQIKEGRNEAYDYGGVPKLVDKLEQGQGITSFNPEEQAAIVEDYYRIRSDGNPDNDLFLATYARFVRTVSTVAEDQLALLPMDSGDTLGEAFSIASHLLSDSNTLNGTVSLRESIGGLKLSWSGWVPSFVTDTTDIYRLNVTSGNLNLSLTGMTADGDLQVIQDSNSNGVIDAGEVIAVSTLGGSQDEAINLTGLAPGDFFIKVDPFSGFTNYTLTVST